MDKKIELNLHELKKLTALIQTISGIYIDNDKLNRYKKKIEAIVHQSGLESFNAFYHQIRFAKDRQLLQKLIESVTINETYFWREHKAFHILVDEILPLYIKSGSMNRVRILVLPSSSAEEVYSIMIAIKENKTVYDHLNIEIIGADIDSHMIKKAKTGLYSKRSVEKLPKKYVEHYFKKVGEMYQIDKSFVNYANFLQVNLFDGTLKSQVGEFDIIFSRNMLIYFDRQTRKKAFEIFYNLLKPSAYLFLGHADANGIDKSKFKSVKNAFHIYQKI